MTNALKIRKVGNSLGVVLPKELVSALDAAEGDELTVTRTENGFELTRKDAEFDAHMKAVEELMARYPNTLRALAK
ncbi:MAG: AbrB/MazE/SpoVT family DNA-binding domain-containing protein [Pseudomonadota bacterium]